MRPHIESLLHQNGVETPLTDDQLLRLNPFAVTFRYDDMDVALLALDEVTEWVTDIREWAENQVRAAASSEEAD